MTDDGQTLYGREELTALVRSESVLDGAFECLRRIWDRPDVLSGPTLADAEYRTRLLEHRLDRLHSDLYDDLIATVGNHPLMNLEDGCGLIMDGLSIREGLHLARDLPAENGWDVELRWATVEALPTETEFACSAWFDSPAPSTVNRDDFRYVGDMDVPQLPGTSPEYVWTRIPDERLEAAMKGNYATEDVAEIYADTKTLLEDVVDESVHNEFLVTSDHGYVNHLGGNPYNPGKKVEELLSEAFSGRYCEADGGFAQERLYERGIIVQINGYYVVKGHHTWTKRGASKKIMHGGLSLPECMTPVLRITT